MIKLIKLVESKNGNGLTYKEQKLSFLFEEILFRMGYVRILFSNEEISEAIDAFLVLTDGRLWTREDVDRLAKALQN